MRNKEIVDLWEAYTQVHEQETSRGPRLTDTYDKWDNEDSPRSGYKPVKRLPKMKGVVRKEEVEIAAEYFYEMGLNDGGVEILIEELGEEEFVDFVFDIVEQSILTEARAGGVKIEPKLSSGKPIQGKPKAASLKALRKQKAARKEAESKASESKPSGLKASLKRQSAIASAKKQQPKKKSALDHVAGAVLKGIDRHNKAMGGLKKMGAATRETAGKVKKAAGEFKKGFTSEETDLFDYILEHLLDEGYAETPEAAEKIMANMSEEWRDSIVEMSDFAAGGGNAKMKQTGMSKAEVEALGKKNLAKKPTTSGKTSEKSSSENSTPEKKVKYGELVSKPGEPKRYSPHGEVTASHKFHSYNQSRDRADDIASWKGLNRKDPAVQAKLKKWADTNYRQNIAMDTNDPNYDPTKTSYPKF